MNIINNYLSSLDYSDIRCIARVARSHGFLGNLMRNAPDIQWINYLPSSNSPTTVGTALSDRGGHDLLQLPYELEGGVI